MLTVLILESDPLSRVHYLRALSGLPGACVVASSSEAEAQTLLGAITPDLVVADARWLQHDRLAGLSKDHDGSGPSVIAIQEPTGTSAHAAGFRVIACLSKPVATVELRRAAQTQLVKAQPDLWFSLADYIQLACHGRRSLQLAVTSNQSAGVVTIEQGHVWSASYSSVHGVAGLALALGSENAQVALWPPLVCPGPREIAGDWPLLQSAVAQLLEESVGQTSLRRQEHELDFSDVLAPTVTPNSTVIESGQKLRSGRGGYDSLVVDAVIATIARRYTDALQLFEEASALAPDNHAINSRVVWLRSMLKETSLTNDA